MTGNKKEYVAVEFDSKIEGSENYKTSELWDKVLLETPYTDVGYNYSTIRKHLDKKGNKYNKFIPIHLSKNNKYKITSKYNYDVLRNSEMNTSTFVEYNNDLWYNYDSKEIRRFSLIRLKMGFKFLYRINGFYGIDEFSPELIDISLGHKQDKRCDPDKFSQNFTKYFVRYDFPDNKFRNDFLTCNETDSNL